MHSIQNIQLDPFSYCNSKCWYCPTRYINNPKEYIKHMDIDLLDNILNQIFINRNNITIDSKFFHFYTGHYNEILLYKHFYKLLELFRKYKFKFMILSNGVNLTESKLKIISDYEDVISGINLNIPSINKEKWKKYTNLNNSSYNQLLSNLNSVYDYLHEYVDNKSFSIGVNGLDKYALIDNGGFIDSLDYINNGNYDLENELEEEYQCFKNLFPKFSIYKVNVLVDRSGILDDYKVFSNIRKINLIRGNKDKVIGCYNGEGRPDKWLHINSNGLCFICCNDYLFEYVYGDLKKDKLVDIWNSERHKEIINKAYNEICRRCIFAVWG